VFFVLANGFGDDVFLTGAPQSHEAQAQVTSGHDSRQSIQILIDGSRQIELNLMV